MPDTTDKILAESMKCLIRLQRGRVQLRPAIGRTVHALLGEIQAEWTRKLEATKTATKSEETELRRRAEAEVCKRVLMVVDILHRRIDQTFDRASVEASINHGLYRSAEAEAACQS